MTRNANSVYHFRNYVTNSIQVKENSTFSISDPLGLKLLTRFQLNFNHINAHKFRHNFRDTVDSMCSCGAGIETTGHHL